MFSISPEINLDSECELENLKNMRIMI